MIGIQPVAHFSYICGHGKRSFLGPERLTVNERELLRLIELMFLETAHNIVVCVGADPVKGLLRRL